MSGWFQLASGGVSIRVKAVPGARSDGIVGVLGDCLKIRVSAPPEDGRANQAIARLLAGTLGIPTSAVELRRGASSPRKEFLLRGVDEDAVRQLMAD